ADLHGFADITGETIAADRHDTAQRQFAFFEDADRAVFKPDVHERHRFVGEYIRHGPLESVYRSDQAGYQLVHRQPRVGRADDEILNLLLACTRDQHFLLLTLRWGLGVAFAVRTISIDSQNEAVKHIIGHVLLQISAGTVFEDGA